MLSACPEGTPKPNMASASLAKAASNSGLDVPAGLTCYHTTGCEELLM